MTIVDSMKSSRDVAHTMTEKMGASARRMTCDISIGPDSSACTKRLMARRSAEARG